MVKNVHALLYNIIMSTYLPKFLELPQSAPCLFQNGVDQQLIMSHTGHRSVDSYKRIGEEQKKSVSHILNTAHSGVHTGESDQTQRS